MKHELERGFVPFILIAIVAVLAIGGGVYYVKQASNTEVETETEVEGDAGADSEMNTSGSLRALLGLGKDVSCTFTSQTEGVSSAGTMYITADGKMRGDFTSNTSGSGTVESHMIVDGSTTYVWSGSQGTKMSTQTSASASAQGQSSMNLDTEVDYECSDWSPDNSKFAVPSTVEFIDLSAMLNSQVDL